MRRVTAVQFGTFFRRKLEGSWRFRRNAIPDVFDELDALGNRKVFEALRGSAHMENELHSLESKDDTAYRLRNTYYFTAPSSNAFGLVSAIAKKSSRRPTR